MINDSYLKSVPVFKNFYITFEKTGCGAYIKLLGDSREISRYEFPDFKHFF